MATAPVCVLLRNKAIDQRKETLLELWNSIENTKLRTELSQHYLTDQLLVDIYTNAHSDEPL
jgi:hypothetical protein